MYQLIPILIATILTIYEYYLIKSNMKDDRGDLDLTKQIEVLYKKVRDAEGELSIIKCF